MQEQAWVLDALERLRVLFVSVLAQLTDWSDRIYLSGYEPLARVIILVAACAAVLVCIIACADERDAQTWSTLTVAGRWMGVVLVVGVVLAAGLGRFPSA